MMIEEEFVEERDFVRCELCGECMRQLHNHIIRTHGISVKRYLELFPNSSLVSEISRLEKSKNNIRRHRNVENHRYVKKHVYLLPDGSYASKSDKYKRAWGRDDVLPEHIVDATTIDYVPDYAKRTELGIEGEDYVVCAICGEKKGSLTQHLRRRHGISAEEYGRRYGLPVHCRKNLESFHQCTLDRWQTLFSIGAKNRAVPKVLKGEDSKTRRRDDITKEEIDAEFLKGSEMADVCGHFHCSDTTLRSVMKKLRIKKPSRTVLAIRRAVRGGAERNLETESLSEIDSCVKEFGKAEAMRKYGVGRMVFDTWRRKLKAGFVSDCDF